MDGLQLGRGGAAALAPVPVVIAAGAGPPPPWRPLCPWPGAAPGHRRRRRRPRRPGSRFVAHHQPAVVPVRDDERHQRRLGRVPEGFPPVIVRVVARRRHGAGSGVSCWPHTGRRPGPRGLMEVDPASASTADGRSSTSSGGHAGRVLHAQDPHPALHRLLRRGRPASCRAPTWLPARTTTTIRLAPATAPMPPTGGRWRRPREVSAPWRWGLAAVWRSTRLGLSADGAGSRGTSAARACGRSSCRRWRRSSLGTASMAAQAEILRMSSFWRTPTWARLALRRVGENLVVVLHLGRRLARGDRRRRGSTW